MRLHIGASSSALLFIIASAQSLFDDCLEKGVGYNGQEIRTQEVKTPESCQQSCQHEKSCKHWTWKKPTNQCTLFEMKQKVLEFKEVDEFYELGDVVSGPKVCTGNLPLRHLTSIGHVDDS